MRGMPGGGKSTIAKKLAGDSGTIHSTDELSYVDGKYAYEPEKLKERHDKNYESFIESLKQSVETVICDNTNMKMWEFARYKYAAEEHGYRVALVTVPFVDVEVAHKRNAHNTPKEAIEKLLRRWEPYTPDSLLEKNIKKHNAAYIDGANLYTSVQRDGWELDYERFFIWLKEKYKVDTACIFLGFIPKYKKLYKQLKDIGYELVFKDVVYAKGGKPKGNCDAELVVRAMRDSQDCNLNSVILVSSDGDYASLVSFLKSKSDVTILSPAKEEKCSVLLKRTAAPIVYLYDKREQLKEDAENEKAPSGDGTPQGSLS